MSGFVTAGTIKGVICDKISKETITGVLVYTSDQKYSCVSNFKGEFYLDLPTVINRVKVYFSCLGYKKYEVNLVAPFPEQIQIYLENELQAINEVVVTAEKSVTSVENVTVIKKDAIKHIQAFSFADVLELLPGKLIQSPSMANYQAPSLREVKTNPLNTMNSLGTSIRIDGADISNNASLNKGKFEGNSLSSIDMRDISTDDIESVEIIQGVPSVKYGDLTSGTILIKSKVKDSPFVLKSRLNPTTEQFRFGKGWNVAEKSQVNTSMQFTRARSSLRSAVNGYKKILGMALWQREFGEVGNSFKMFSKLNTSYQFSGDIHDVDKGIESLYRNNKFYVFVQNSGVKRFKNSFVSKLNYNVNANYSDKEVYDRETVASDNIFIPVGEIGVLTPAKRIKTLYDYELHEDSRPFSFKVSADVEAGLESRHFKHRFLFGFNYVYEKNLGKGTYYDRERPPYVQDHKKRIRPMDSYPALRRYALFAEDKISTKLFSKDLRIQLGLRFSNFQPSGLWKTDFATILEPRVNVSYVITDKLKFRAACGVTSRSAPLSMLSPNPVYFDESNIRVRGEQETDPNVPDVIAYTTTFLFNTNNPELELAKAIKQEYSIYYQLGKHNLSLSFFNAVTQNAYGSVARDVYTPVDKYRMIYNDPVKGTHMEHYETRTFMQRLNVPGNKYESRDRGVDLSINIARINAINTYFNITGSFFESSTKELRDYISYERLLVTPGTIIPIYTKGRGSKDQRFSTKVRAIYTIAPIDFILSMTMQTIWYSKSKYNQTSRTPVAYIQNRKRQEITEADLKSGRFDEYILPDNRYTPSSPPPLFLFNMKLTKSIGENVEFAFNANNFFYHRPIHNKSVRNPKLYFGGELTIKL
ncbi:TonB-dependent receptor [Prolixibacteraceae bacterium JC049]|nr:TonB-dependent receptor [Prolixibacteraceae bacterium JC049]